MRIRFAELALPLLLTVGLIGCGEHKGATTEDASRQTAATSARTSGSKGADPCSLLEPKEVAAVIGALAGPPYRTHDASEDNEPADGGDTCVYETSDFRTLRLAVIWQDGAVALKAITIPMRLLSGGGDDAANGPELKAAKTLLPGGVQIAGEWDEASSMGCCQIYALRGDSLVTFDYRGWRADTTAAVGLLNKALLRLDQPLPINGNLGNDAARKHAELRPTRKPACELLERAEIESIVGPLLADPKPASSDGNSCAIRFTQAEPKESPLKDAPEEFKSMLGSFTGGKTGLVAGPVDTAISVLWRGGFRRLNDSAQVSGAVTGSMTGAPGMPTRKEGPVSGGPWDEAGQNGLEFVAVKKDVAISIDTPPMLSEEQIELRRRLVARAIAKI